MTTNRRKIVAFDFDGTLTTKDTLLLFIRFAAGTPRFITGLSLFSPLILMMMLKLYDNSRCKERLFSWFFKGMPYSDFVELGKQFAAKAASVARADTTEALKRHKQANADIYIVSASIEEWVRPYCERLGVKDVIATKAEVDADGLLTGRFASPNCYGAEKVRRLLAVEPERDSYRLIAYGDSSGDKEMFLFADEHFKV